VFDEKKRRKNRTRALFDGVVFFFERAPPTENSARVMVVFFLFTRDSGVRDDC